MSLPEPNWQPLQPERTPDGQKSMTRRVDLEARQLVCFNLGRKWTRRHDVAWTAYMVKNGYLPAEELERAREEFREERATKAQLRRDAGLHNNTGFRIW